MNGVVVLLATLVEKDGALKRYGLGVPVVSRMRSLSAEQLAELPVLDLTIEEVRTLYGMLKELEWSYHEAKRGNVFDGKNPRHAGCVFMDELLPPFPVPGGGAGAVDSRRESEGKGENFKCGK